jgi:hypothetical protein
MAPEPLPQLSPELVLILPPEVAAIARMTLPDPSFASPAVARPTVRHRLSPRRAVGVAAVYAAAAALTITPLALAFKAVPSHRAPHGPVNPDLRAERTDAH